MKKENIVILGATGSIGYQTYEVCLSMADKFNIVGISAHKNVEKALELVHGAVQIDTVVITDKTLIGKYSDNNSKKSKILYGEEAFLELTYREDVDTVIVCVPGSNGIKAIASALQHGKKVINANKEAIYIAGNILKELQKKYNGTILPLDGEHIAIMQCLLGEDIKTVDKLLITASGGALRDYQSKSALDSLRAENVLKHPSWNMGNKITVDCATLINKAMEVVVAHWMYDIPYNQIDVLIHRESIVHSLVSFFDKSMKAQLAIRDMRVAAAYILNYPTRIPNQYGELDLLLENELHFEKMKRDMFPCFDLAIHAAEKGRGYPIVVNAANEIAIELFLKDKITFGEVEKIITSMLEQYQAEKIDSIEGVLELDYRIKSKVKEKYRI